MRCIPSAGVAMLCLAWMVGTSEADETKTVSRYVTFRDGSVLRFEVVDKGTEVKLIRKNGLTKEVELPISQIRSVQLTSDKSFAKKAKLLALVQQLGSVLFEDRQKAQVELQKLGRDARFDLQLCFDLTTDTEIRSRLRVILSQWPAVDISEKQAVFDLFELKGEEEAIWGHLSGRIPVLIDGKVHSIAREDMVRLESTPPAAVQAATASQRIDQFGRIEAKDFPDGCTEINFERTLDGTKLQPGTNVERLFVGLGMTMDTSFEKSFVSINDFSVRGKSQGMSVATQEPRWQGEITIRFVDPSSGIAAGVHRFGCWIAAVVPQGTYLIGYDVRGREIGRIATRRSGSEFIAVASPVPMHTVRVVPNPVHDRDYTLDDFIFDPPTPLLSRDGKKFTVQLGTGESLLCDDLKIGKGKVELIGPPAGLPDWQIELSEVSRIGFPREGKVAQRPSGVFVELGDGSILFGKHPPENGGRPTFERLPDVLKEGKQLAAVWSSAQPLKAGLPPSRQTVVWDRKESKWVPAEEVKFLEKSVTWKGPRGVQSESYQSMPPFRFAQPEMKRPASPWRVQTVEGDDLVLTGSGSIEGKLSEQVKFGWQDQTLGIPAAKVRTIYRASGQ